MRTVYNKIAVKINRYFFEDRYTAHSLITLRISVGVILLLQLIVLRHDILSMIQTNGIIRQELVVTAQPWYYLSSNGITHYITAHFPVPEFTVLHIMGIVYTVTIITMMIGLFTRISAIIIWLLHLSVMASGYYFIYGMDFFLTMLLFYIVIFPTHHEFSVDKYLFRLKPANYTPYIRILQIHLCIVYFVSGFSKAVGGHWWNGISIVKAIVRPGESLFSNTQNLGGYQWLFILAGIGTVIVEIGYPIFINIQKTRKFWLLLTYLMHLSIAIFLNLPLFAATMVLFNICAFYYPIRTAMKTAEQKNPTEQELQLVAGSG